MESLAAPSCLPCLCLLDDHVELAHAIRTYAVALVLKAKIIAICDVVPYIEKILDNYTINGVR